MLSLLAEKWLDVPMDLFRGRDSWLPLRGELEAWRDSVRSSSGRRAAHRLASRGLLEVRHDWDTTDYHLRAGGYSATERVFLHVRLPQARLDPKVFELAGATVLGHFTGIEASLSEHRELLDNIYVRGKQPDRFDGMWRRSGEETRRVVADHRRQLDRMPPIGPVGWAHVYVRWVAHSAAENGLGSKRD